MGNKIISKLFKIILASVDVCLLILPQIISKLFQRLVAAHEYFSTSSAAKIISDVVTCEIKH